MPLAILQEIHGSKFSAKETYNNFLLILATHHLNCFITQWNFVIYH